MSGRRVFTASSAGWYLFGHGEIRKLSDDEVASWASAPGTPVTFDAAPRNPWIPADPDSLPPKTYPQWRKDEMARRGVT